MGAVVKDSLPRILFLALSRNQEKYYRALVRQMPVNGLVINAKHPGMGRIWRAAVWVWMHRNELPGWACFRLDKGQLAGRRPGRLFQFGLAVRIIQFIGGVMRDADRLSPQVIFLLNGEHYKLRAAVSWAKEAGIKLAFMELGFLPNTIALDGQGVNCNNSIPRDPGFYRRYALPENAIIDTALVRRPPRRAVGRVVSLPEHYFFVPFQVPTDTQVLVNSPWVRSMEALYQVLLESVDALPDEYQFVVKEHPTSKVGYPHLHHKHPRIIFANANDTQKLVEGAKGIITLNSTVGIEGLLIGKPVITLGHACYNIEGLVAHADNIESLRKLIAKPNELPFDVALVHHFIAWLKFEYLLPGPWPVYDEKTPIAMRKRLEEIIAGLYQ